MRILSRTKKKANICSCLLIWSFYSKMIRGLKSLHLKMKQKKRWGLSPVRKIYLPLMFWNSYIFCSSVSVCKFVCPQPDPPFPFWHTNVFPNWILLEIYCSPPSVFTVGLLVQSVESETTWWPLSCSDLCHSLLIWADTATPRGQLAPQTTMEAKQRVTQPCSPR